MASTSNHSHRWIANDMHVAIIVNLISGRRGLHALVGDVCRRLRASGCQASIMTTTVAGDAAEMARKVPDTTRAVLAVGGDGTVREVAEGLLGRPVPIVVVPGGTENIVARECGMTLRAEQIVETVLTGRRQACDVGMANGRCFLIIAGIGFDAEVTARLAQGRTGHISYLSYLRPTWDALRSYGFPAVRVEVDGSTVFEGRALVFVGVMGRYSLGLRILRDALWDDGLFDVCVLPCVSRGELVTHAVRIALGRHIEHEGTIYLRGKYLRVSSDEPVPVEVDGEAAGVVPVELSIRPRAVTLLVPRVR